MGTATTSGFVYKTNAKCPLTGKQVRAVEMEFIVGSNSYDNANGEDVTAIIQGAGITEPTAIAIGWSNINLFAGPVSLYNDSGTWKLRYWYATSDTDDTPLEINNAVDLSSTSVRAIIYGV